MKNLIIGAGQVGHGLYEIFKKVHETHIRDVEDQGVPEGFEPEILHICYPAGPSFVATTLEYVGRYQPRLVIIHSSVPVGTTETFEQYEVRAVHSPVRGRHPHLEQEMPIYSKFIGGKNEEDIELAAKFLMACSWPIVRVRNPRTTELIKLLSNIHMGLEIAWRQEVDRMIAHFGADTDVYATWEETYFTGYAMLKQLQLIRPRMKADPVGGHCILECTKLLAEQFPSMAFDFIGRSNEQTKLEAEKKRVA